MGGSGGIPTPPYAGFFEEIIPENFRVQIETNLFGPVNVTRALLPVMRAQRSGLVVTMSSSAGIFGQELSQRIPRRSSASLSTVRTSRLEAGASISR